MATLEEMQRRFPQLAPFLRDPEIFNLLNMAIDQNFDATQFQAALWNTNWWKTHGSSARQWDLLLNTDPASASAKFQQALNQVSNLAYELGVKLEQDDQWRIADQMIRWDWDERSLRQAVAGQFHYNRHRLQGGALSFQQDVRTAASEYAIPLGKDDVKWWTTAMVHGNSDMEQFTDYLKQQARSRFGFNEDLVDAIDAGMSVKQYAAPYVQMAAQELEVNEADIQLNQDKWLHPLQYVDRETGKRRSMNLAEWQQELRSNKRYGWDSTTGAKQAAAELADTLSTRFGFKA